MWITELARNTATAARRIGSQRERTVIMGGLQRGGLRDELRDFATFRIMSPGVGDRARSLAIQATDTMRSTTDCMSRRPSRLVCTATVMPDSA